MTREVVTPRQRLNVRLGDRVGIGRRNDRHRDLDIDGDNHNLDCLIRLVNNHLSALVAITGLGRPALQARARDRRQA